MMSDEPELRLSKIIAKACTTEEYVCKQYDIDRKGLEALSSNDRIDFMQNRLEDERFMRWWLWFTVVRGLRP
jgi:hypothetical protein